MKEKKGGFNKAADPRADNENSDTPARGSRSDAKRKVDDLDDALDKKSTKRSSETLRKRRSVSVYDAVVGRAGKQGFLPTEPVYSKIRDKVSSSTRPAAPDDILFDRKHSRVRLPEEGDYVGIAEDHEVPPSELLEILHRYVSQFYDRPEIKRKHLHYKSMDGTALLALGILIEEILSDSLGETGHLAFLGLDEEETDVPLELLDGHVWVKIPQRRRKGEEEQGDEASNDLDEEQFEISNEPERNSSADSRSSSPEALVSTTEGHSRRKKQSEYKSAEFVVSPDNHVVPSAPTNNELTRAAKNSRAKRRDRYEIRSKTKSIEWLQESDRDPEDLVESPVVITAPSWRRGSHRVTAKKLYTYEPVKFIQSSDDEDEDEEDAAMPVDDGDVEMPDLDRAEDDGHKDMEGSEEKDLPVSAVESESDGEDLVGNRNGLEEDGREIEDGDSEDGTGSDTNGNEGGESEEGEDAETIERDDEAETYLQAR